MKITPTQAALTPAALLFFAALLCANAANAAAPGPTADPQARALWFDTIQLGLNAKPPAQCTAALFGTITARSPDGALCLCRQSYGTTQGFWEQIGTGKSCWPDKK